MIILEIGAFIFIPLALLVFVLALSRAAAIGDQQFERARLADRNHWSESAEYAQSNQARQISPDTRSS